MSRLASDLIQLTSHRHAATHETTLTVTLHVEKSRRITDETLFVSEGAIAQELAGQIVLEVTPLFATTIARLEREIAAEKAEHARTKRTLDALVEAVKTV